MLLDNATKEITTAITEAIKVKQAQINELLCKILCHNLCVLIQEVNELGIKGEFIVERVGVR